MEEILGLLFLTLLTNIISMVCTVLQLLNVGLLLKDQQEVTFYIHQMLILNLHLGQFNTLDHQMVFFYSYSYCFFLLCKTFSKTKTNIILGLFDVKMTSETTGWAVGGEITGYVLLLFFYSILFWC